MRNIGFFMHNRGRYFVQQLKGGAPPDTEAPTVPVNLAATSITATGLTLTWDPSTDNVGVVSYEVEQAVGAGAFSWLATVAAPTTTLAVSGLTALTTYRFRVRAVDAVGNMSAWGPSDSGLSATTDAALVAPEVRLSTSLTSSRVLAVLPDGSGGYYIGGNFDEVVDSVGTHARLRLAHLDAAGLVTAWDPGSDQVVWTMALWGDYVAIGKDYNATLSLNTLGGVNCRGFGLVHKTTGVAFAWDPAYLSTVDGGIAVVGDFGYVSGAWASASTDRLKKYNFSTKTITAFSFSVTAATQAMSLIQGKLYVGWDGTTASTPARNYFFAIDTATDTLDTWDCGAITASWGNRVVPYDADHVMICGWGMTAVQGTATAGACIVDRLTGTRTAWAPSGGLSTTNQALVSPSGIILWTSGTNGYRVFDAAGAELRRATHVASANGPEIHGMPLVALGANKAIAFGVFNLTSMGAVQLSGSRSIFVVNVP
jgi:hypothetical protein